MFAKVTKQISYWNVELMIKTYAYNEKMSKDDSMLYIKICWKKILSMSCHYNVDRPKKTKSYANWNLVSITHKSFVQVMKGRVSLCYNDIGWLWTIKIGDIMQSVFLTLMNPLLQFISGRAPATRDNSSGLYSQLDCHFLTLNLQDGGGWLHWFLLLC